MGLRMGKGMCHVVGRACQVAGVLEGCGVGDVNEIRTIAVSNPRVSIGPAGCRINRDYAR